jgi:hypothetical protein
MVTRRLPALALLVALAGCGTLSAPPPSQPANTVARSTEQDGKFVAFVGPRRPTGEPFLGVPGTNFYALRSWIDTRNGETRYQLYVEDSYFGAERNWEAARNAAGQKLKFVPISKNEITCDNGCSYAEEFGAELPEPLLQASTKGLTVTFTAKSGAEKTVAVPGELVEKQLAAMNAERAAPPTASAAPPAGR